MLPVCEPGDSYSVPWTRDGFSRCFLELVGSISSGGVVFVLGLGSIVLCSPAKPKPKKGQRTELAPPTKSFYLTVVCSLLYAITFAADLLVKGLLHVTGDRIYGYTIVMDTVSLLSWVSTLALIYQDKSDLAVGRGHGWSLSLFWTVNGVWLSLELFSYNYPAWWWGVASRADVSDLVLWMVRVMVMVVLLTLMIRSLPCCYRGRKSRYSLLVNDEDKLLASTYGSITASTESRGISTASTASRGQGQLTEHERKEGRFVTIKTNSAFSNILAKAKVLFPYVWPKGHFLLQLRVIACFLLLVGGRVINVFVPIFYKRIVDALTPSSFPGGNSTHHLDSVLGLTKASSGITFPAVSIVLYVFLRFLQGGSVGSMGLINNLRSYLWIRVQQFTSLSMQVDLFKHLHSLSLRWHLGRKTGEVLKVMDRGTQSVNNLLSYILFNIVPTLVDVGVAVVYFIVAFDGWFGLIVFTTMLSYIYFTIFITEWRTKFRRVMNERDNITRARAVDSLLNFETVKYYGAEHFEVDRFKTSVVSYQSAEWVSLASLNILNSGQNVIITLGLLLGASLCAYRVTEGDLTVGDFVLYCTYIIQLYSPLNFFGTYYRMIQAAFVDMENMFDLLEAKMEIKDAPQATPIRVGLGEVEFKGVYFHYVPEKPILKNVTFTVHPGETMALVGPSGAGKSTIIRLLFRFYDVQDGAILLDGQDLRDVTQSSLRQAIGVVPQDTVLFNDNIHYNIKYGKHDATEEEVKEASQYADIHERILTFPQQYDTVVGERGLKLSGGEKQRVCIARTILKSPSVILLDEATSALDTETERHIQTSLQQVCQGRTTIIVAHRLSTIIHAHQILVLKDGVIAERGRHDDLLEKDGLYASMWAQQQKSLKSETTPTTTTS